MSPLPNTRTKSIGTARAMFPRDITSVELPPPRIASISEVVSASINVQSVCLRPFSTDEENAERSIPPVHALLPRQSETLLWFT